MKVPFLDLKSQYHSIRGEILAAVGEVFENTAFAGGPYVARFEEKFAEFCGCAHAVGVGSGTSALWTALLGLGVREGDEVITACNTFIATAEAVSFCGATPVFVDVDRETMTMDPAAFEAAITPRTKAVIPVHLYGQMCDMDPIMEIARRRGLFVVEDSAQAHGAEYKGRRAGSIGDAGCFSFYPGKNLGAYGEAGAVVTNNETLAARCRMFRDHGQRQKYHHSIVGWNDRMDGAQGAILEIKLKYLPEWNAKRRDAARLYGELLGDVEGVELPVEAPGRKHIYHLYEIRVNNRDEFMKAMADEGIGCGIHYPIPVHLQDAYRFLEIPAGSCPVAERCAERIVSLPMFPELTEEQVRYAAGKIREWAGSRLAVRA